LKNKIFDKIGNFFKREDIDAYSFNFKYYEYLQKHKHQDIKTYSKGNLLKCEHISYLSCWHNFESLQGEQSYKDILNLLQNNLVKISAIRQRPIISYIVNINSDHRDKIKITNEDINYFIDLIEDIEENVKEIDLIIYSIGGCLSVARKLIEILYNRFDKVNFLVTSIAYSAATMMCMSANEIIMTPESSLSPFDVQILSPDTGNFLPIDIMLKCAKEAKQAHNPLNIFVPKSLYKNWNKEMSEETIKNCVNSSYLASSYPTYWLMKYMYKSFLSKNEEFNKYFVVPIWKYLTKDGRKAKRIVEYFIDTGVRFSHSIPIMYSDIKNSGLNVHLADAELLALLRENAILSEKLFERSSIFKLYMNEYYYHYTYLKNE